MNDKPTTRETTPARFRVDTDLTPEDYAKLQELAVSRDWSVRKTTRHLIVAALEGRPV